MAQYCVNENAQDSGDHEVHNLDVGDACLPDLGNRHALGDHLSCSTAVDEAKKTYAKSNGCAHCAPDCHTT